MPRRSWPSARASRSSSRRDTRRELRFEYLGRSIPTHSDRCCALRVYEQWDACWQAPRPLLKSICCSWASSSAGRAPRSQRGGRRFDPGLVHQTTLLCESRMLHPAFGVMRPEELVFILANSARRGIREPSVVDSIRKLRESDLHPQPFSIPARRMLDDSCCS